MQTYRYFLKNVKRLSLFIYSLTVECLLCSRLCNKKAELTEGVSSSQEPKVSGKRDKSMEVSIRCYGSTGKLHLTWQEVFLEVVVPKLYHEKLLRQNVEDIKKHSQCKRGLTGQDVSSNSISSSVWLEVVRD